jgi:hypothetical protein
MTLPPCFNFSHDRSSPLRKEEQYICQAIDQIATENKDFACIAGSFPLVQLLRQNSLPTFFPGDVDIFTTTILTGRELSKIVEVLRRCLPDFDFDVNNEYAPVSSHYAMVNVRGITTFRARSRFSSEIMYKSQPVQIIFVNSHDCFGKLSFIKDSDDFASYIMNCFDINVCRCAMPDIRDPMRIISTATQDIFSRRMEYDIRKYTSSETAWRRITKYIERGFNLTAFRFDDEKVITIGQRCFEPIVNGASFDVCMIDDIDTPITPDRDLENCRVDDSDPTYRVESI